jgi:signal peptidase I
MVVKGSAFAATKFAGQDLLLGPDEYFMLGDNRFASSDSRVFGPVRREEIEGKVEMIWYSRDAEDGIRSQRILERVK